MGGRFFALLAIFVKFDTFCGVDFIFLRNIVLTVTHFANQT